MLCGAICLSHSPLMHHNRASKVAEAGWNDSLARAQAFIEASAIDLCVIFYPDHINGVFYNLLPPFCVVAAGHSLGDFGTAPGMIDIPEDLAVDCHSFCIAQGADPAISFDMTIDHGATQPFEALAGNGLSPSFLPIFINCAAPPLPIFARTRALGHAVGKWAEQRPERILVIGSGGLSHDPPMVSIKTARGTAAERLRKGGALSYEDRLARQRNVLSAGKMFRAGGSTLRALNPEWDKRILELLAAGHLDLFDVQTDQDISDAAGNGAHELRTWVAALSAMTAAGGFDARFSFYEAVDEWITGMGLLIAASASRAPSPAQIAE